MTTTESAIRTRTLARILGPYLTVMGAVLLARGTDLTLILPAFMQDGALVFTTGAFTLMAGLTVVATHHHFTSLAAIVISLVGIVAVAKGASLMIAPDVGAAMTHAIAVNVAFLSGAAALLLLVGLWLSFVGWFAGAKVSP